MKYIYLNLISILGFIGVYMALQSGFFLNVNNFVYVFPRSNFLIWLFFIVTDVGGLIFISLGSLFLISLLAIQGKYQKIFYTAMALFGGLVSQTIIKNMLEVARPENSLVVYSGYAFPSGHTNMATILFLSICFYLFQDLLDKKRKMFYFSISIFLIVLVGISRVYLNAHWVSDVLAGWCLGLFWATVPLVVAKINTKQRT